MNVTELKAEHLELQTQLALINTQIKVIIPRTTKKYSYSNVESSHSADIQSLDELFKAKKAIKEQMSDIESQLAGVFVKLKNYS